MEGAPLSQSGDFAEQASAYARSRPGYPAGMLEDMVATAGLSPGACVCEIGAGTGAFTRELSGRFTVTALEPGAAMRAHAPELDGVTWSDGSFEQTGLAAESQEWVVAAQSFHWADPPRALPEIHRVLRPQGPFTVLWNGRENEREETLSRAWGEVQRHVPGFEDVYKEIDWVQVLESTGHFRVVAAHKVRQTVPMDRQRFLDLWRSHHRLSLAAGRDGVAEIVANIERDLEAHGVEHIEVPYACRGWTARAV